MALKNQNFEMYQGENKRISFHIVDSNGLDKNLVGATIEWILVYELGQLNKTTTDGTILISGSNAQVVLFEEDTVNLKGNYQHEMRVTDSNGLSEVVALGKATIFNSLTR